MSRRQECLRRLSELLGTGRYPHQSKLPPERELALQLGVSRSALREALEILEAEGRVWRHVGMGTFVGGPPTARSVDLNLLLSVTNPDEILEVRMMLEPSIARSAALRATTGEMADMHRLIDKSEDARYEQTWELWDIALHRALAMAARNRLLLALFDAVNAMRRQSTWGLLRTAVLNKSCIDVYNRQHQEILAALERRDGAASEAAMRRHIETVRNDLLSIPKTLVQER